MSEKKLAYGLDNVHPFDVMPDVVRMALTDRVQCSLSFLAHCLVHSLIPGRVVPYNISPL